MRHQSLGNLFLALLTPVLILVFSTSISGQDHCISKDDVNGMVARVKSKSPVALNKKLREELLKPSGDIQEQLNEDIRENRKPDAVVKRLRTSREKNTAKLCSILRQHGWPSVVRRLRLVLQHPGGMK